MTKRFVLEIYCGNAAFDGEACEEEVARILQATADKVIFGDVPCRLMDHNGNAVGTAKFVEVT